MDGMMWAAMIVVGIGLVVSGPAVPVILAVCRCQALIASALEQQNEGE